MVVAEVSQIAVPPVRSPMRSRSTSTHRTAFQTLFLGPENHFVESMIARIINQGCNDESPFVFWGVSGTGKSLIGRCILHYWTLQRPSAPALMTSASDWVRHVDQAGESTRGLTGLTLPDRISLFWIEDLESLAGRTRAQHELSLLLDELQSRGIPILATCKLAPSQLHELEPRLASRLMSGTLVQVNLPSKATMKEFMRSLNLSPSVTRSLSRRIRSTTSLLQLQALASRLQVEGVEPHDRQHRCDEVLQACARYFGCSLKQLRGPSRRQGLAFARRVTVWMLRDLTQKPFKEIGRLLGGRDHSTVLHAFHKVDQELKEDLKLYEIVDQLRKTIRDRRIRSA